MVSDDLATQGAKTSPDTSHVMDLLCNMFKMFNPLWPGDFNEILDEYFSRQLQWFMAEIPAVKLPTEECH